MEQKGSVRAGESGKVKTGDMMYSSDSSVVFPQIMYLLMSIIGIGIAVRRRAMHPQLSLLAGIYFLIKAILSGTGLAINSLVIQMVSSGETMTRFGILLQFTNLISTGVNIIAAVMALYMIYGWRNEKEPLMIFKP